MEENTDKFRKPNYVILIFNRLQYQMPVTVAERSKACTVFAHSEAGIVVRIPLRAWMLGVYVCVRAFFCVCAQVAALRRADHPPKEFYRLSKI
jgi:hypothetical protein